MADIKIAGKLVAGASDGVLAGADSVKDTSLNLFQDNANKTALANGVFNVTNWNQLAYNTVEAAAAGVPSALRRLGMVMTYQDSGGVWHTVQFTGDDVTDWTDGGSWSGFGYDVEVMTSAQVAAMDDP